jgi:beta-xylosidase
MGVLSRCSGFAVLAFLFAQPAAPPPAWISDLGDGRYRNPVLYADYSDPDAIRVGDDYYMTSSSFSHFPGLPILHSKDLVNWTIVGHAAQSYPYPEYAEPRDSHLGSRSPIS